MYGSGKKRKRGPIAVALCPQIGAACQLPKIGAI